MSFPVAVKVALTNMKGGVGKSTLAVNLAWGVASQHGVVRRVLVVDIDPQFNASQYLLGARRYEASVVDSDAPTIWDIFEQTLACPAALEPRSTRTLRYEGSSTTRTAAAFTSSRQGSSWRSHGNILGTNTHCSREP